MRFKILTILVGALVMIVSLGWKKEKVTLKNGTWRTTLQRNDGAQIIFNMETKDSAGKKILLVMNAGERLLVDDITVSGDSVFIEMPFFESGFRARIDGAGNLRGNWIKRQEQGALSMPFTAVLNDGTRFPENGNPIFDVSGKWAVTFKGVKDSSLTLAVGEFEQSGTHLRGTFLTTTGDYRFLEGTASGDSLKLSAFDGGHAFLFVAKVNNDRSLSGKFYSGFAGLEDWTAVKDAAAALPDGYDDTKLKAGASSLDFKFKSIDGKVISIKDPVFRGKVVVVQIMGSWCPNCMDETAFLSDYYNRNKEKGVEVIALAYERSTDFARSVSSLRKFQRRFNVKYPILVTGVTLNDSLKSEKTLPQLEAIKAFPTSIFIDKAGRIRKIYTGFTGPGTGIYYKNFAREFDEMIKGMLKS